ncbi:hypothetical protein AX14_009806 [Amanita brunnescens Koide BX004]|nr:hypothetical protein AX14_009806 [Amanita brunnescens Koide BX004]
MLRKPMTVSAIRALPASPSSQAIPTQSMPDLVKTRQGVSKMAHQTIEIRARVSLATMKPRLGEIPFAESIERSNEYSEMAIGPDIKRALTSSSAEVERRRVPTDAIISIHNGEEEDHCSPHPSAVLTLPASAPTATSVPHMRAVNLRQQPYEWVPPFEGVSRRQEPSVVSKASEANDTRSPVSKAAPTLHKATPVSAAPRVGKMPYVAYLERSSECSTIVIGTAVKPSPTSSRSSEVGKRRRVSDTIVNIQNGDNGDEHTDNPWTVSTMYASAPTILSVIATRAATHPQPSDGPMPLNEMMSRRHGLNVAV